MKLDVIAPGAYNLPGDDCSLTSFGPLLASALGGTIISASYVFPSQEVILPQPSACSQPMVPPDITSNSITGIGQAPASVRAYSTFSLFECRSGTYRENNDASKEKTMHSEPAVKGTACLSLKDIKFLIKTTS